MALFSSAEAVVWLIITFFVTVGIIYLPLFGIFYGICRLDGSLAIRLSWTTGMLIWLIYLTFLSGWHSRYLMFWSGDMSMVFSALVMLAIASVMVLLAWVTMPHTQR